MSQLKAAFDLWQAEVQSARDAETAHNRARTAEMNARNAFAKMVMPQPRSGPKADEKIHVWIDDHTFLSVHKNANNDFAIEIIEQA